ncbi:MAG: transcriptional regulator [Nitrosopumilaceae archaeon]
MQNGIDNLLVPSMRKTIEENLGKKTLNKIEERLVERHGMNLVQSIKDFYKFDSVLREFFGAGADGLEAKFLQKIVELEKVKNAKTEWITIQDQDLAKIFLESFGDPDKKAILNAVLDKPHIVSDILKNCKIPQTSGYRKINSLINDGLLIPNGQSITSDGKKVTKYETLFNNINIEIEKNTVRVKIQMKKNTIENSSILQVVKV